MSSRRKRTRQEVGERNQRPRIPLAPGGAAAGGAAASAATMPSDLPQDRTIGRDPLIPNKDYIWEDADGWLPLDWAGRKEGFRLQQEARCNTQYNPRRQNNYVDLTQRPGSRLNQYRDQVDLTGPETAEEEAIARLQQHVMRTAPAFVQTLDTLIAKANARGVGIARGVEIKQETTDRAYYITIAGNNSRGERIRKDWPSLMTKTKQEYASEHRMVYDTGAMGSSVSWELAKRLGIVGPNPHNPVEEIILFTGVMERVRSRGVGGYALGTQLKNISFWVLVSGTYAGNQWVKITTDLKVNDEPEAGGSEFSLFGVDSIEQLLGKHRVVFTPG